MKNNVRFIAINLSLVLAVAFGLEASVEVMLNNSSLIPNSIMDSIRSYYMKKDRKIIQYLPACAHHDNSLFYKLNVGEFEFSNREFSSSFSVNAKNFRDDEISLDNPSIIFLGDSYTMGWGVEESEAFPSIVEQKTGLKALNTGVSSYGTVREFESFKTLDTSNLEYLIVQYAFNDYGENSEYYFNDNQFVPSTEEEYNDVATKHAAATKYFPLKHISHFASEWFRGYFPEEEAEPNATEEEEEVQYVEQWKAFMNVLQQASIPVHVKIIVLQVGSNHQQNVFLEPLRQNLEMDNSLILNQVEVLDIQASLNTNHYHLLDQHLNVAGNQVIANELIAEIERVK